MNSAQGKRIHLSRLIRPSSGRGIIIAASHPILYGPIAGQRKLEETRATFAKLCTADAVMTTQGTLRHVVDIFRGRDAPGLVMHMDWMNWDRPFRQAGGAQAAEGTCVSVATVEELVAAGVDGLMTYLYLGHSDTRLERDEIDRNARIARACEKWGLAMIIEPQPAQVGRDAQAFSAKHLTCYARIWAA